ncbi:efflux RND transporter periplasmic adaptor subunit [Paenibacillus solisilvae]|uniref:Efflux RND transporter periplasmic adaptor subunit n=1 Tax=Paenibacillus solisilvae TaxID=2486751 RepID=A0ABW0W129_9BACL
MLANDNLNSRRRYSFLKRVTLIGCTAALLSGCSVLPAEEETLQPPLIAKKEQKYETAAVKRGNMQLYLSSVAVAASEENKSVAFAESGGLLKKMLVAEGDKVSVGTPIAELDTGDLPTRIKLQKLTVEQKQINVTDAVKNNNDQNTIRLYQIDLDREQLVLDSLVKEYNKSLLFSPIEGDITYLNGIKPGQTVEAQATIAVISNPNHVNFVYEATDVKKIANINVNEPVDFTIDGKKYKGTVLQTPKTAPKTLDIKLSNRNVKSLILGLSAPKPVIKIGDYADFKLFIEKRDNVLIIPRNALKNTFGRYSVSTIENDRVKELDVQVGLITSSEVEIIQGLNEDQKVIISS